jgi:vacuolar-type H+-ATPase subunit H
MKEALETLKNAEEAIDEAVNKLLNKDTKKILKED